MAVNDPNPASPEKISILERQGLAIELRKQGKTYREIGTELSISCGQAYNDVQAELNALSEANQETAETLRQLENLKLDLLEAKTWPKLDNLTVSYPATAQVLIRLFERRAKLNGLDAPTAVSVTARTVTLGEARTQLLDLLISQGIEPAIAQKVLVAAAGGDDDD